MARSTGLASRDQPRTDGAGPAGPPVGRGSVRQPRGGSKPAPAHQPTLLWDLDTLVEPTAPGDSDAPLHRTCLSTPTAGVAEVLAAVLDQFGGFDYVSVQAQLAPPMLTVPVIHIPVPDLDRPLKEQTALSR